MITYTQKELTEKKYTVGQAVGMALVQIKRQTRGRLSKVCVDSLKGRADEETLTMKELNEVIDQLTEDTYFYDGSFRPRSYG